MSISVCMASYNGEKFIKQQIESILIQLSDNDELIISDDKSTDSTIKIIGTIKDKRIKLITNNGERGYTKNFENALKHASGDLVFLADQDDIWCENKVSTMKSELITHDLVISDSIIVDENLKPMYPSHFSLCNVKNGFLRNFLATRYVGACMAFNKNVLNLILPFPKNQKLCSHDYWITIVSELNLKVCLVNQPLILYRRHGNNASNAGLGSGRSVLLKVYTRIYCAFHLMKLLISKKFK